MFSCQTQIYSMRIRLLSSIRERVAAMVLAFQRLDCRLMADRCLWLAGDVYASYRPYPAGHQCKFFQSAHKEVPSETYPIRVGGVSALLAPLS
jgi:hypothetical protein